jgi:hypothetical protein
MTQQICEQVIKMSVTTDGHALIYHRKFTFGAGEHILFPVASYPALKTLFDMIYQNDAHTITLKQTAAAN